MIQKHVKEYAKNSLLIGATGIGIGLGTSIVSDAGGDTAALGKLGKGLGPIASLTTLKTSTDILGEIKFKKRY